MSKVVLELQKECLDPGASVPALLRKAHVIAQKLGLTDFDSWCQKELKGYSADDSKKPLYRMVTTTLKALNPYRGYIPVFIEDEQMLEKLTNQFVTESVDELETLTSSKQDTLVFSLNPKVQKYLMEASGISFEVRGFVSKHLFLG